MERKIWYKVILFAALAFLLAGSVQTTAYAGTSSKKTEAASGSGDIDTKFNKLTDLVASIVSSVGTIITLWGISEFGMALQGNDGMMQAHSFRRMGGGFVMVMAPQILSQFL